MNTSNVEQRVQAREAVSVHIKTKSGIFGFVTQGTTIVRYNKWTGNTVQINKGFYINIPFLHESRELSNYDQPLSTPHATTTSSDNIRITYDTDYQFKIKQPVKYVEMSSSLRGASESTTIESMIGKELDQLVSNYVKKTDSNTFRTNSNIDIRTDIQDKLDEFENKYGIEITKIILTDVKLPEVITKAAEEAAKDAIVRPKELENAKNKKAIAAEEAEAIKIKEAAKVDILTKKIKDSLASGGKDVQKEILEYLGLEVLSHGTNQNLIITSLGNAYGQNTPEFNMMYAMFNQMMQQNMKNNQQQVSSSNSQQMPAQSSPVFQQNYNDEEYLTVEQSIDYAQKHKMRLGEGRRISIDYLTDDERELYGFPRRGKTR